jgi:hypothetical protein
MSKNLLSLRVGVTERCAYAGRTVKLYKYNLPCQLGQAKFLKQKETKSEEFDRAFVVDDQK